MRTQNGSCVICYESYPLPMQSGCGCRGDNGLAHYQCVANKVPYQPHRGEASWRSCQTCLRPFTGQMRNHLARIWVENYRHGGIPNRDEFLRAVSHLCGCILIEDNECLNGMDSLCWWYGRSDSVAFILSFLREHFQHQAVEGGNAIIEFGRFQGNTFQFLLTPGQGTTWVNWFLSAHGHRLTDGTPQASELRRWLLVQEATNSTLNPSLIRPVGRLMITRGSGGKFKQTDVEPVNGWMTIAQDDPKALVFKGHLALALSNVARFRESNSLFKAVIGEMATVYGTRHPSTMQIQQHHALSLIHQGLFSDSERANRKLLGVLMATYGETNSSTMACVANLATSLTKQGKYTDAESQLQRLLSNKQRVLGHEHASTCQTNLHLSYLVKRQRKLVEHAAARKRRCELACSR